MKWGETRWLKIAGMWCIYCGEMATSEDHFPPVSVDTRGWRLPACKECNSGIGDRFPFSFWDRCDEAKRRIEKKHAHALAFPHWDEEDLEELGPNMRRNVKLWQRKKRIAHARIAWNVRAYLLSIETPIDFVRYVARTPGTATDGPLPSSNYQNAD